MQRESAKWLEDIWTNGQDAPEFLQDKTQEDYLGDKALRAMIERKLFIVGEAVCQLRVHFPEIANQLPETQTVAGFRNLLAHGYFALDHRRVCDTAIGSLPRLLSVAKQLLGV